MSTPSLENLIQRHAETLAAAPGDAEAFEALESLYRENGRFEELLRLYQERARLSAGPSAASGLLAKAAELAQGRLSDPARAEELYGRALGLDPRHPGARRALAEIRSQRGDLAGLAESLEEEADLTAEPRAAAARYLELGRFQEERLSRRDRAALFYTRAWRLDPQLDEARRRAMDCTVALRRFLHAKRLLDTARAAGLNGAGLAAEYARLGNVLAGEPLEHGLAVESLAEALALDRGVPGAAEALSRLKSIPRTWRAEARALAEEGQKARDRREGARLLLRAAELHAAYDADAAPRIQELLDRTMAAWPGMPEALDFVERWYGEREDHAGLRDELRRLAGSVRDRSALAALQLRLSQVELVRFGDGGRALAALERALDLDPSCEPAALQAFEMHVDAGRTAEALSVLDRHLAAAPQKPQHAPLRLRAAEMTLSGRGDRERARRHLEAALRVAPGYAPAAAALAPLLREAGDWRRLVEVLELCAGAEPEPSERARLLEQVAEVQRERLGNPREAMHLLAAALQLDPRRAVARKGLEAVAAATGAFLDLARVYRAAAASAPDVKTRKTLLRRVAEIFERDLAQPEEAVRAYRALAELDPDDRGAASALEACLARAGQHQQLVVDLERRLEAAPAPERRELWVKLARIHLEAGEPERAASAWQEVLSLSPEDPEALRGLVASLEAQGERRAADLAPALARLSAVGGPDRADLALRRAALLVTPLDRPAEAAAAYLALLRAGGLGPAQLAQVAAALERLLSRGVEPVRIAQALAPLYAAAGDPAKHVAMLELLSRKSPPDADGRERARLLLDSASLRADRLGDPRGALDAAAAALRACPTHAEARRRAEELAGKVGAHAELYALLVETAGRLEGRPDDERAVRMRAALLAEQELGKADEAAAQLARCLQLSPTDLEALAASTRVALAAERWEEAADRLLERTRLAQPAEKVALLAQLGEVLLERLHSPAAAADVFRQALDLAPAERQPSLLAGLAAALEQAGDPAGQARALSDLAALARDPIEAARAWAQLARVREQRLGDRLGAVDAYRAALEKNPADQAPQRALEALLDQSDGEAALAAARALGPVYQRQPDPRRRLIALEVEARALKIPAERAAAFRRIAAVHDQELGQPSQAFTAAREAFRATPADPVVRHELRRLAEHSHMREECARAYEEALGALRGEAGVPLLRELAEWCEQQLGARDRAAACLERLRAAAPGDPQALSGLRRLHRATERWQQLNEVCAEMARRSAEPAERLELWREAAAVAESKLGDPARAAEAWRQVAELDPADAGALVALERLYERLDRPADLAWTLERRRAGGARDAALLFRLAELGRTRLEDPAGALALYAEVLRSEPGHAGARDALVALARVPGPIGREALALADALLRSAADHGRRVEALEGRLANVDEPNERARLHAEIRALLESELKQPERALAAARRACAEGGRARAEAVLELPRLAEVARRPDELAAAYQELAEATEGEERLEMLRRAARVREQSLADRDAAVAAWKRLAEVSPDDPEALEALQRLYVAQASAGELLEVTRRRARLAEGEQRIRHLMAAAELQAGPLADPAGAVATYRELLAAVPGHLPALEALRALLSRERREAELVPVLEALAEAWRADPARRVEVLLERAALLEGSSGAVAAYAEILSEHPHHPAAAAGLERLLGRPETRPAASRLLEDLHRATGDGRRLVSLLEQRLEEAAGADRAPLLAEISALHQRLGQKPQAFLAKLRQYREALRPDGDDAGVRAELERLAGETGSFEELAAAFEDVLERGLDGATAVELERRLGALYAERLQDPARAARWLERAAEHAPSAETFGALARLYRRQNAFRELADVHRRQAALAADAAKRKDLLFEVATIMEDNLSDREGAMEAYRQILNVDPEDPNALRLLGRLLGSAERWDELVDVLDREVRIADRRPNFAAEAAELRFRLGRIRQQRLSDLPGALDCFRGVLAQVPRHPGALSALEEMAHGAGSASAAAAEILEPIYQHENEHQKLVETLEARLANLGDPAARAELLRRVAQVYAGPLRNPEMGLVAAGRAVREDPDGLESLELALRLAGVAGLEEELGGLLAENADRAREPAARAEYRRCQARLQGRAGGDPGKAAEEWQRVLEIVPDDPEALEGLTAIHRSTRAGEPLAQVLRRRLGVEEDAARRVALLSELAQVQEERLKDPSGAMASLRRLLDADPRHREALGRLDRLCVRAEKWVELADVLAREIAASDAAGDAAAALVCRFRLGELKETRLLDREGALTLYEEILAVRPDHAETVGRLEALLQKDPSSVRAASALERAYEAAGAWPKYAAVLEVRASERPDPQERKALFAALAEVREKRLGNAELAFLALCRAFREDPADPALREELERLADATGHHEELAGLYEDELEHLGAGAAPVVLKLASLHEEKLNGPERAAELYERARRLDPAATPVALAALDRLYRGLERWPQLAEVLSAQAGRETRPAERVALLFRLGQLCEERLAAPEKAVAAYEAILAADPRHLPALRGLERIHESGGRADALLRSLAAQREVADASARERITAKMAQVAGSLGRDAESVTLWQEVLREKPRQEQALAALEQLLERLERWPELAELCRTRLQAAVDRREAARLNDKLGWLLGTKLGNAAEAVQSFKAVLDSDPRNRRALEALRDIYAAQGDRAGLAGVYRRLVPLQEDAAGVKDVRLRLAEVLLAEGQRQEAIEQCKRAFDLEPHGAADLARIEEVFRAAGAAAEGTRAAEARATLLAAEGKTHDAVAALHAVAELWLGAKKPEAAAAALEKARELEPGSRETADRLRSLYAQAGNWRAYARVSDQLLGSLVDEAERLEILKELAEVHEKRLGQKEMAFLAWCRAFQLQPADAQAGAAVERLAAETEAFEELCDVYEQVAEESRGATRARLLLRMGRLRDQRLDDAAGAEAALRRALETDPANAEALDALAELFGRRGRVRDLVIALEQKLEAVAGLEEKKATLLEMARIYDGQLHDLEEAVGALRRVLELDGGDPAAIEALSTLFRREQRWQDLAAVLARARDLAGDDAARIAYQLQISGLYESEIADDEAAIEGYRAVLGLDDRNAEALAGLERLYTKLDRFAELNRVYEKQAEMAGSARDQVRILGKSASIWEEKLHNPHKAIERHERILQLDGASLAAVKGLERLYRQEGLWDKLITVLRHHLTLTQDRREVVGLHIALGDAWWKELGRVDQAEEAYRAALDADPESRDAVSALGKLYERSGNWNLALEMLRREARLAGGSKDAVDLHARIGRIHEEMLLDVPAAKEAYLRALDMDPGYLPAIRAVKGIYEREQDRAAYLEALVAEAKYTEDDAERARLHAEAGRIHEEERGDRDGAARHYEEALKRSPDYLPAAFPLSDIYQARADWERSERVLDVIVQRLEQEGEAKELCRQCYRLGYVAEKLGKGEKALQSYRRAYELDATYLPALEGLGHLLVHEKSWEEALRIFQAILIHHRDGLTDLEVVETYWQIGEIQVQLGQPERAAKSFEKALEMDANHEPSRRSLVRVLEGLGDYEGAVEHRQKLAPLLEGRARFEQHVAIGEICRDRLKDPYQAVDAYLSASRIDPTDVAVTEALLGLYRETRQGQKAADVLASLLGRPEVQADVARAAKLHFALAEILRDEIRDEDAAVAEFEKALDKNPRLVQAFSAVEAMLTASKKWPALEQAYVRMIQRLPKGPDLAQARLALWKTLGELYRRVLENPEGARMAYEVVVKADPEDAAAVEILADLCGGSPGHEAQAIAAYRQLLAVGSSPQKAVSALVKLHASRKEYDRAYGAAQALAHLLGAAKEEELQVVSKLRRFARDQASRSLDDQLWVKHLLHQKVSGPLVEIMKLLVREAGSLFAQSPKELKLNARKDEIDVEASMLFFVNMFKYVARTLGLEGLRLFKPSQSPGRLVFANTDPPGVVVGEEMFKERPKKELWFSIAKVMAFARPELRLARLMPHDQLDVVFQAACSLGTSRFVVSADPHQVEKLKHQLEKVLPERTRTQTLKKLAREYCAVQHPGDVRAYMDGAELTSNRAGALLAGDLEVVKRMVLSEKAQVSKLRDETKVKDLVQFCVSDDFAELREQLGLSVVVKG